MDRILHDIGGQTRWSNETSGLKIYETVKS